LVAKGAEGGGEKHRLFPPVLNSNCMDCFSQCCTINKASLRGTVYNYCRHSTHNMLGS